MAYSLWNDQIVEEGSITVSPEDRGYQFGDGIYEVVKVYNGQMFTAQEHIDRFYASAEKIRLVIPYTKDVLHKLLHDLIEANKLDNGHVYFQITRGTVSRNHVFPDASVPAVLTGNVKVGERSIENFQNGVKATFVEDIRWLRCDIKSLNLLGAVLAKQEASEKGCYEAILHRGDTVTECSSANVYGIKGGKLYTHPANNFILNGITRQIILKCATEIGLPVIEEAMTKGDLLKMDEVIVSSVSSEVTPVIDVDGHAIGTGAVGEWTRKLQEAFEAKLPISIKS
ncbi:D-alanine aminotransferase [Lysinibacillus contaminans]|uniref:D-alanine aminotransferase n=1 Tax=Lysinibacillus contaminans TaxID=1293441 RepID=A0ABR5JY60_9BACI|nr:D-amino-acid transaminase [Lysinibacillus contaminans]KOS67594.1 D-alanine aminotransferase [Lysinibacillus contaminans]